jgi:hypothetical protein
VSLSCHCRYHCQLPIAHSPLPIASATGITKHTFAHIHTHTHTHSLSISTFLALSAGCSWAGNLTKARRPYIRRLWQVAGIHLGLQAAHAS